MKKTIKENIRSIGYLRWPRSFIRDQIGFSLVELLVAVLLGGIITAAALAVYMTQHNQWIVQDEIADMQANARAAIDEMATRIGMAGYRVPEGVPAIRASNSNPDTILVLTDSNALTGVKLEQAMSTPSSELRCTGYNLDGLNDGDWALIYDPATKTGEFFLVSSVNRSTSYIYHATMPLSRVYSIGSQVLKLNEYQYFLSAADSNHTNLMLQISGQAPQVFAENITNLNFTYVLDSGQTVDLPADASDIREVLISVDAITGRPDVDLNNQYRTRTLTTRVKVRNLGLN